MKSIPKIILPQVKKLEEPCSHCYGKGRKTTSLEDVDITELVGLMFSYAQYHVIESQSINANIHVMMGVTYQNFFSLDTEIFKVVSQIVGNKHHQKYLDADQCLHEELEDVFSSPNKHNLLDKEIIQTNKAFFDFVDKADKKVKELNKLFHGSTLSEDAKIKMIRSLGIPEFVNEYFNKKNGDYTQKFKKIRALHVLPYTD